MKIGGHIWNELGALASCIEMIKHDPGEIIFKPDATQAEKDAVASILVSHDPTPLPAVL